MGNYLLFVGMKHHLLTIIDISELRSFTSKLISSINLVKDSLSLKIGIKIMNFFIVILNQHKRYQNTYNLSIHQVFSLSTKPFQIGLDLR